ncbi:MAG: hypothetical protein AAF960_05615 [Bacteroidota bacterium]
MGQNLKIGGKAPIIVLHKMKGTDTIEVKDFLMLTFAGEDNRVNLAMIEHLSSVSSAFTNIFQLFLLEEEAQIDLTDIVDGGKKLHSTLHVLNDFKNKTRRYYGNVAADSEINTYILNQAGKIIWMGSCMKIDVKMLDDLLRRNANYYGRISKKRFALLETPSKNSLRKTKRKAIFSIEYYDSDDPESRTLKVFTNGLGYYHLSGALSNVLPHLLEIPDFYFFAEDLNYNPVIEIVVNGTTVSSKLILDNLEEIFEITLEKRTAVKEVLRVDLSSTDKLTLSSSVGHSISMRDNMLTAKGVTVAQFFKYLEGMLKMKILFNNNLEDFNRYDWKFSFPQNKEKYLNLLEKKYNFVFRSDAIETNIYTVRNK